MSYLFIRAHQAHIWVVPHERRELNVRQFMRDDLPEERLRIVYLLDNLPVWQHDEDLIVVLLPGDRVNIRVDHVTADQQLSEGLDQVSNHFNVL